MTATVPVPDSGLASLQGWMSGISPHLGIAILVSLLIHLSVLLGVSFRLPPPQIEHATEWMEVVLVNSKSSSKPVKTKVMAQNNLDGGGNTEAERRAKSPFPVLPERKQSVSMTGTRKKTEKQLEQEAKKLMAAIQGKKVIAPKESSVEPPVETKPATLNTTDLMQRSLEIARLEAQIARNYDEYQKRPKRKFIGARTKEFRFARYVEDWRTKVERIGNLNYPEEARREKIYGNLQLTVGIKADGEIESIEINRSSGQKVLDEAAVRIVRLAGQNGFAPFPPEISQDTDILHITRTWVFTRSDGLVSE